MQACLLPPAGLLPNVELCLIPLTCLLCRMPASSRLTRCCA